MSRVSHRSWSKGSARGAGPSVSQGTVRIRTAEETSDFSSYLATRRWCRCGAQLGRCDDCGQYHCGKPGHLKHRCGLEPQVCSRCWTGYYVGRGEARHVCAVRP